MTKNILNIKNYYIMKKILIWHQLIKIVFVNLFCCMRRI
jgi:hypothetical protein